MKNVFRSNIGLRLTAFFIILLIINQMWFIGYAYQSEDATIFIQDENPSFFHLGIDVSEYNGEINWDVVASYIEFAIIRVADGGELHPDTYFDRNVQACERLGIPYGVYIYSRGKPEEEAIYVLSRIQDYHPTLPIFYDVEDPTTILASGESNDGILHVVSSFCQIIENAGFRAGVYADAIPWNKRMTSKDYDNWCCWVAQYDEYCNVSAGANLWQYSSHGTVPGINSRVDMNYWIGQLGTKEHRFRGFKEEPTCAVDGSLSYHCQSCDLMISTVIPALGHNWDEGKEQRHATASTEGVMLYTCLRCGELKQELIPKLPLCEGGEACPSAGYSDIPAPGNWAHAGIDFCVSNGLMSSTSIDKLIFSPKEKTSRAMIVVILHRLEGSPKVSYKPTFDDVPKGKWFSNGIIWAENNGIVTGYGNRKFGPNDIITREQLATIMQRYTTFKGYKTNQVTSYLPFPDSTSVSIWAQRGIAWAVGFGMINGKATSGSTILDPKGFATRAETATILMRYIQRQCELEPLDNPFMCTHTWLNSSVQYSTCIKEGKITYFCADCNAEYTDTIPKSDHKYSVKTTYPTCSLGGYDTYTCTVCGYSYTTNYTSALDHYYVNGYCSRCGAKDPDSTPVYYFPFYLYSNDGKVYLGKLVTNKFDSDSIWNQNGTYGSQYSQNSIWNEYGTYGSSYSSESAFNNHATKPPIIVDARGNLMGYLTTNTMIYYGYTIVQIRQFLLSYNQ